MATKSGLIRSFYGWLAKTEAELPPTRVLPFARPTTFPAVESIARKTLVALRDSPFEERARYWANLFSSILSEGWKGEERVEDDVQASINQELTNGNMAV